MPRAISFISGRIAQPVSLLDDALRPRRLQRAWCEVRANHGAPGSDGVDLAAFGSALNQQLALLRDEVRSGDYRPRPVRVAHCDIKGKARLLEIAAVRDRVLQRAVLDVLMERFDRWSSPLSYGYRPRRGVQDAVRAIDRYRDGGLQWLADADIHDCFGQISHALLKPMIHDLLGEPGIAALIECWMDNGSGAKCGRGIALGSVVSPFLCNLFLDPLDQAFIRAGLPMVRYADDFVVLCRTKRGALAALDRAAEELQKLDLQLNAEKSIVSNFIDGFVFLGVRFQGGKCTRATTDFDPVRDAERGMG